MEAEPVRFAFPGYFRPLLNSPPGGAFRVFSGLGIGAVSGFAGIGGGILTNIVMTLSGLPMHKSIGRAAATGVIVSIPATLAAATATGAQDATAIGSIDVAIWICIAPAQAAGAWFGARLAPHIDGDIPEPIACCDAPGHWCEHVVFDLAVGCAPSRAADTLARTLPRSFDDECQYVFQREQRMPRLVLFKGPVRPHD